MKFFPQFLISFIVIIFLSSCGVPSSTSASSNNNSHSQVKHLSKLMHCKTLFGTLFKPVVVIILLSLKIKVIKLLR